MKLSFELKLEIYEKHLAGYSLNYLADEYHLAKTTVKHFCNLADRHGTDILRRSKKKTYSNQFKLNAISCVFFILSIAISCGYFLLIPVILQLIKR